MKKNYVILGQGLAGTVLAFRLLKEHCSVRIIDDGFNSSSSMVAAGLWNPIVFRRINKSWMADILIPSLYDFYAEIEDKLKISVLNVCDVWRMHSSKVEADLWMEKISLEGYSSFLSDEEYQSADFEQSQWGSGLVKTSGYLDLKIFLESSRTYFEEIGIYTREHLDGDLSVYLKGNEVIDCRGANSAKSPYWSYLPFGLTKGEVLTIHAPQLNLEKIFNAGFFLCPLGEGLYRLGATFDWENKDRIPTEKGKSDLLAKLNKWTKTPFRVIDHQAGIRPTVQDRRPLIGTHPEINNLHLFNGLGTKGVMIAPHLSTLFTSYVINGDRIPGEVNIERFSNFFGKSSSSVNYPVS